MSALADILKNLTEGRIPDTVSEDCEHGEQVRALVNYLEQLSQFVGALACGDLDASLRLPGRMAGNLKGLHANLRHLTWQTQQVAAGDFSQRVEFLGGFSEAFNSMVEALAQARAELTERNEMLAATCEQLKTTQAQLLQQEKMAAIGQLAAGMAHEINNPLGFVTSNLGSLEKYCGRLKAYIDATDKVLDVSKTAPELSERLAAYRKKLKIDFLLEDIPGLLAESMEGTGRVKKIVQDLRNFSRIDAAETAEVDLNQCLESTLSLLRNGLEQPIDLIPEFGEIPQIPCQPQELNQVFMNLLQNAVQAIEGEGVIRVRTFSEPEHVLVEIADSGCGMSPERQDRIFEPFFTTKPVGQGTGLGLSICYEIIKKHGGTIQVESAPGQGSTFRLRLPLMPPDPADLI